jgi:hypothetical protein
LDASYNPEGERRDSVQLPVSVFRDKGWQGNNKDCELLLQRSVLAQWTITESTRRTSARKMERINWKRSNAFYQQKVLEKGTKESTSLDETKKS